MTAHDQRPADDSDARAAHTPMDADSCLAVLSLLLDDRPVDPVLEAQARAFAAAHPELADVERQWRFVREALAGTPARRAREGFTGRVLAALAATGSDAPLGTLQFARRLALAASLALAVTIGWDLMRPASLQADAGLGRARHAADNFRDGPFDADDNMRGLRARQRAAGCAARGPAAGDAR
jgi:hypothetical protein